MTIELTSLSSAERVMDKATWEGKLGNANDTMNKAALKLLDCDEFDLSGSSRKEKFLNTLKTFTKGGACVGALVGTAVMLPYDVVVGRGNKRFPHEPGSFIDHGVLGQITKGTVAFGSSMMEIVGYSVGVPCAAINPAVAGRDKKYGEWVSEKASYVQEAVAKTGTATLGNAGGLALSLARLPSLLTKYVLSASMATGGAIIGFIGGSIRAMINR